MEFIRKKKKVVVALVLLIFLLFGLFITVMVAVSPKLEGKKNFSFSQVSRAISSVPPHRFGSSNYDCTGSCYCENRRSSLSKSALFVAISAISTISAARTAQAYFDDHCEASFSGECEEGNIYSEVEECSEKTEEEEISTPAEGKPKGEMHYVGCSGHCVLNQESNEIHTDPNYFVKSEGLNAQCEKYNIGTEDEFDMEITPEVLQALAHTFLLFQLNPFCGTKHVLTATESHMETTREEMRKFQEDFDKAKNEKGVPVDIVNRFQDCVFFHIFSRCLGNAHMGASFMGPGFMPNGLENVVCEEIDREEYLKRKEARKN